MLGWYFTGLFSGMIIATAMIIDYQSRKNKENSEDEEE